MRDSARLKAKPNCVGCEAGQLHQHLPGYEPDALTVKLQTKIGRIPRCCPGPVLVPNQASSLALSYPMKLDVRPRLALGKVDLRTTGSTTSPCARLKLGFSVGAAPTPSLPQREVLLLHHEKHLKWRSREDLHLEPPLPQSGVHDLLHFGSLVEWCGMSVLPRRALFGRQKCLLLHQCRNEMVAGVGSAPTSADFRSAAHLSEPSSVMVGQASCLPSDCNQDGCTTLKWSLGVVTLHGLSLIGRVLCC